MTGKKSTYLFAVLCVLFTSSVISDVNAKLSGSKHHTSYHSGSHTYPSQHHSSGSSVVQHKSFESHSYPSSSGGSRSSGSSSSYGYPSSTSLSGSGNHGSFSSSSGHGYPAARPNSLSGGGTSSGFGYPSSNIIPSTGSKLGSAPYPSATFGASSGSEAHGYPAAKPNSLSGGSSGYPSSNTFFNSGTRTGPASYPSSNGLSGNRASGSNFNTGSSNFPHNTYTSNTYHSSYGTGSHTTVHHHYVYNPPQVIHYGSHGVTYPVYRGTPPRYVYEYQSSGSRYSQLLSGLALYNLGRMSANSHSHSYHDRYTPQPDEYCTFGVQYRTGGFEEMQIDCRSITYFIYEFDQKMMPDMNAQFSAVDQMQKDILANAGRMASNPLQGNTMTTTQVMRMEDPRFMGAPVVLRPDMECFVTRHTRMILNNMKKIVPCDLLQTYSTTSLRRNSSAMMQSSLSVILAALVFNMMRVRMLP